MSGLVFIHEYGMTGAQSAWLKTASSDESCAFFLSGPVRIACQQVANTATGDDGYRFLPTIHGAPVLLHARTFLSTPEEALAEGLAYQARMRERLEGRQVELDLDALGIRGAEVAEYATVEGRMDGFLADVNEALGGNLRRKRKAGA